MHAELDAQYRQLREECGMLNRTGRCLLAVTGPDAADYLQGQLTQDIEPLRPGQSLYAALLDRKAHIQADMRVIRLSDEELWLDLEPEALGPAASHLRMYKIGREVEVADLSESHGMISLAGPATGKAAGIDPGPAGSHLEALVHGTRCRAVSTPTGTIPGLDLIFETAEAERLLAAFTEAGTPEVSEEAFEILRIEAAVPRFGHEISIKVMPAEAGIVDRAVSFTKGCYIGQEPVARLHYKGRPNRVLRQLELSAPAPEGSALKLGDKEVGTISSSAVSPARGPIALAIVRREAEPGTQLTVGGGEAEATVTELAGAEAAT